MTMQAQEPKLDMAKLEATSDEIEKLLDEYSLDKVQDLTVMRQAIKLATGVAAMRKALTLDVVNRLFMPLMGSSFGFRTDMDQEPKEKHYPVEVVKECMIEAMMRGFYPVGNEFNIIARRAYFTKEGFERKVREISGMADLTFFPGVPQLAEGKGALVPYRATWTLSGRPMGVTRDIIKRADGSTTDERIAVRVNSGQGADAILGKARRKILAQIFELCTGLRYDDGDAADAGAIPTTGEAVPDQPANKSQVDELVQKHQAKAAAKAAKASPTPETPTDPAAGKDGLPEPGADG